MRSQSQPKTTPESADTSAQPSAAETFARRFFEVYIMALKGHRRTQMRPAKVQEITVGTCDLAELTYLRELRQAIIEAGQRRLVEFPEPTPDLTRRARQALLELEAAPAMCADRNDLARKE